jgi:hypothetical protein
MKDQPCAVKQHEDMSPVEPVTEEPSPTPNPLAWWRTVPNPWRDAIPKCAWGGGCQKIGTRWVSRHTLYCDEHGAQWGLQDAPWAELTRKEGM